MTQLGTKELTSIVEEKKFNQAVVNIGSHSANDIVISGEDVLPFHATVILENGEYTLMLLESEAKIILDGEIQSDSPVILGDQQPIEIGDTVLLFQQNGSLSTMNVFISRLTAVPTNEIYEIEGGEDAIILNVLSQPQEIQVDQTAYYEVEIVNAGPIVANFNVVVQGILEDVVEISPTMINLNEGQRKIVSISITPPRDPSSEAGKYPIELEVTSPNYYGHKAIAKLELAIAPYYEFQLGSLNPRQRKIPWRKRTGTTILPITNVSNIDAEFNIVAVDEENGCNFELNVSENVQLTRQATVAIPTGHTLDLPIDITPIKQKLIAMRGTRYFYTTTVQVAEQNMPPQTVTGQANSLPLIGGWAIFLAVFMIIAGLFFMLQPNIYNFGVAAGKDIIELGDTTRLEWDVSPFATRLNISNLPDIEIERGQTSITVAPDKTTKYELVAGNWLSAMIGIDQIKHKTVLIVPPSPNIVVFEIFPVPNEVDKGQPINIRWSVTEADKLLLTVDKVVYELSQSEFSGEQSFILNSDSVITLEAINASGSNLRSEFVKVNQPNIIVTGFTVWVRPSGSTSTSQVRVGAGSNILRLLSPENAPDQIFTEKLVELVADNDAESGYRVEFYDQDRELSKGEQVMLEWDVFGVDTVQIAPFTEILPNKGIQPFFPQESMNFVMTARSGEVEELFMLPVKVFDGEPPVAPTIEFFQAAPGKLIGPGNVEFAWSVSGNWTRIQLATSDGPVADYMFPQDFFAVPVEETTTFILTAWNNDLSSAAPLEVIVDPALIPIDINIISAYPSGLFQIGGKTLITIEFPKLPEDTPEPTGDVIISDGFATCKITLPATTCELKFINPGVKEIIAKYLGDDIYLQSDSPIFPDPLGPIVIEVQSATVTLAARYYYRIEPAPYTTLVTDITKPLGLDEGLFIAVEVAPSLNLPDDGKSKISLQICDEDLNTKTAIQGTCQFIGGSTIRIGDPENDPLEITGYGYLEITVQKFLSSGNKILIFNYSHDDNAFEPATLEQPGLLIEPVSIYLSSMSCDPVETLDACVVGLRDFDGGEFIFDLRKEKDGSLLPSHLLRPVETLFEFEEDGAETWECSTRVLGGFWKLVCTGEFTNWGLTTMNLNHLGGDPNYIVIGPVSPASIINLPGSFDIRVMEKTTTLVERRVGIKVGEEFPLTCDYTGCALLDNPLITFYTAIGTQLNDTSSLTGKLILRDVNFNEEEPSSFGVTSGTNCNLVDEEIVIDSVGSDCYVYINSAGNVTVNADYDGDLTRYAGSTSGETTLNILQQNEITADWKYDSSGSWVTWDLADLTVRIPLSIRIILDGPGANNFTHKSLLNKNLLVTLVGGGGVCIVQGAEEDSPGYLVNIAEDTTSTPIAVADFQIICSSYPLEIQIQLAFSEDDAPSFAFTSDPEEKTLSIIQPATARMLLKITRFSDSTSMIPSGTSIDDFNVGETYLFSFYIDTFYESYSYVRPNTTKTIGNQETITPYINANNFVNIGFPPQLIEKIDDSKSTCDSAASVYEVPLNRAKWLSFHDYVWHHYYEHWSLFEWYHYHYQDTHFWGDVQFALYSDGYFASTGVECKIVFSEAVSAGSQNTSFTFVAANSYQNATETFTGGDVVKQDVTIAINGSSTGYVNIPQDYSITVTPNPDISSNLEKFVTTDANFGDHFVVSAASCGDISNRRFVSGVPTFTYTPTSDCSETITVDYTSNAYFNASTGNTKSVTVGKHASAFGTPTILDGTSPVTYPLDGASNKASLGVTPYTFTIPLSDNDAAGHSQLPDGSITLWIEDSSSIKLTITDYTIAGSTPSADVHTLAISGGEVVFDITFLTQPLSTLTLFFSYSGSATFSAIAVDGQMGTFSIGP